MPSKTREYKDQTALLPLAQNFPLFFNICFLVPVYMVASLILEEKEKKLREGMRMMGLSDGSYYLSWIIMFLLFVIWNCIVATAITAINVFENTNMFLIFIYLFFYGLATMNSILFLTSFFSTQRTGQIFITLFFVISMMLQYAFQEAPGPKSVQIILSIFPNTANFFTSQVIWGFQFENYALSFDTVNIETKNYTFNLGILMFFIDFLVYGLLFLYFDKVFPNDYGVRRHPCFCFHKSTYKCG